MFQTEGVGTVRVHHSLSYDDDGGLSSDPDNSDDEAEDFIDPEENNFLPVNSIHTFLSNHLKIHPIPHSPTTPTPENLPTPTPTTVERTPKASAGFFVPTPRFVPKLKLGKKFSGLSPMPTSPALTPLAIDAHGVLVSPASTKKKFARNWSSGSGPPSPSPSPSTSTTGSGHESSHHIASTKLKSAFKFEAGDDIVGFVMLEIQSASDLPRLKNSV